MRTIIMATCALALASCATSLPVQFLSPAEDAAAKAFAPPPAGTSSLYIYRNQAYAGQEIVMVIVDEELSVSTGGETFARLDLQPGKHTLRAKGWKENTLDVYLEAGKIHFVHVQVALAVQAVNATMHVRDDSTGRAEVQQCRRVAVDK